MQAEIGIIGGSGFYSLLDRSEEVNVDTSYGEPSDAIAIGTISRKSVAFLPRHGRKHTIPPHKVPYKANIEALSKLGVKRIIATSALGSLKEEYAPGEFVLFDQFVNMTHGREDTFFDQDIVAHVSMADPYCDDMRAIASSVMDKMKITYHPNCTVVVINGPRYSTRSESKFFSSQGFDTVNMTQYPEVALAREKAICYLGVGIVTDYDVGLEGRKDIRPVIGDEVIKVFSQNIEKAKRIVTGIITELGSERSNCGCKKALDGAIITH